MIKKIFTALLCLYSITISAQEVWTEGSSWETFYEIEGEKFSTFFELVAPVDIEGTEYFPLIERKEEGNDTVAFIRSENNDELVYVRMKSDDEIKEEALLYDFTEMLKPEGKVRYGYYDYLNNESRVETEDIPSDYVFEKMDDPFHEGETLPIWDGLIYKLGHICGPLGIYWFYGMKGEIDGPIPRASNVSHLLFGTKKGYSINAIKTIIRIPLSEEIRDLQGRKLKDIPEKGLYIKNGRVRVQ